MTGLSDTAMVLAAGLGSRMRPMTLTRPKPLQMVGGRTMLDHALDRLVEAGIRRAVVNTFYLAEQIEAHLRDRRDIDIVISREEALLDTGGGVLRALPHFGGKPFITLNADLPWIDGPVAGLYRLRARWDEAAMDALLLTMPTVKARGFGPNGDFNLRADGRLERAGSAPPRSHVWISAQILSPGLYADAPGPVFSNNHVWNAAEAAGRLYGVEHDGTCFHVGTPEDWDAANALLASGAGWAV